MKALGKAWKKLKPGSAQRAPYEDMATARKRSIDLDGDADGDDSSEEPKVEEACQQHAGTSPWSIGTPTMPLSPKCLCEPPYSEQLEKDTDSWRSLVDNEIHHRPSAMPFKETIYCDACVPGVCVNDVGWKDVCAAQVAFCQTDPDICSVYLIQVVNEQ